MPKAPIQVLDLDILEQGFSAILQVFLVQVLTIKKDNKKFLKKILKTILPTQALQNLLNLRKDTASLEEGLQMIGPFRQKNKLL